MIVADETKPGRGARSTIAPINCRTTQGHTRRSLREFASRAIANRSTAAGKIRWAKSTAWQSVLCSRVPLSDRVLRRQKCIGVRFSWQRCSRRQAHVLRGHRLHQAHRHRPRQQLQAAMPRKLNGPSASGQPPNCWSERASLPLLARRGSCVRMNRLRWSTSAHA
jgi:hypothetical protein